MKGHIHFLSFFNPKRYLCVEDLDLFRVCYIRVWHEWVNDFMAESGEMVDLSDVPNDPTS